MEPQFQTPPLDSAHMLPAPHGHLPKLVSIIIPIILVGGTVWGILWYQQQIQSIQDQEDTVVFTPRPIDETTNWKTYRNDQYGFELKYPQNWQFRESGKFLNSDFSVQFGQNLCSDCIADWDISVRSHSMEEERKMLNSTSEKQLL